MAGEKTRYYSLDDIAAIGSARERSPEEIRRDAEEMSAVIKAYKLGQVSVTKNSRLASKRKTKTALKKSSKGARSLASRKAYTGK